MKWPYHHVKDLVYRLKDGHNADEMVYDICKDFEIERGLVSKALYNYYWVDKKGGEHALVKSLIENDFSKTQAVRAVIGNEEFLGVSLKRIIMILTENR